MTNFKAQKILDPRADACWITLGRCYLSIFNPVANKDQITSSSEPLAECMEKRSDEEMLDRKSNRG